MSKILASVEGTPVLPLYIQFIKISGHTRNVGFAPISRLVLLYKYTVPEVLVSTVFSSADTGYYEFIVTGNLNDRWTVVGSLGPGENSVIRDNITGILQ